MKSFTSMILGASVIALAATAMAPVPAEAQERARVGVLDCDISGGVGLIIGSRKAMACTFESARDGRREAYEGTIGRFGLDVGATAGGRMIWAVYAPTAGGPAALAGTYAGASGEASVGPGVGANVLVGGSNRTISLQPISVQGQAGLNLALGVSALTLNPVR